jgi:hypothetical protein
VFVSHSGALPLARRLARRARRAGADVFLDVSGIDVGDPASTTVKEALKRCREIVVVYTRRALRRPWIWLEIGGAWVNDGRIVIVLSGVSISTFQQSASVPAFIRDIDVIRAADTGRYFDQLRERLRRRRQ